MKSATPKTQNAEWGFFGTWKRNHEATDAQTERAWSKAIDALVVAGFTAEQARKVLDSRVGRHMADQVDGGVGAIETTVQRLVARRGWRQEMAAAVNE